MTTIIITLELKNKDEIDKEDVIQYLHELIEQDCLSYEVINNKRDKEDVIQYLESNINY